MKKIKWTPTEDLLRYYKTTSQNGWLLHDYRVWNQITGLQTYITYFLLAWSFPHHFFIFAFQYGASVLQAPLPRNAERWWSCSQEDTLQRSKKKHKFQCRCPTLMTKRHIEEINLYHRVYDSGCCADKSGASPATGANHSNNETFTRAKEHWHVNTWLSNRTLKVEKKNHA